MARSDSQSQAKSADKSINQPKRSSYYRRKTWFPLLLITPAVIIILLVVAYPMVYSVYISFTPYNLLRPDTTLVFSVDTMFRNYQRLLENKVFWRSVVNTVLFLAVTVNLSFLIALALTAILFWSQSRWVYYAGDKRR